MTVEVSSAIPGMEICLDYRPTGQVTPATVGGMDPASHAGSFWYSASHSILLRHAMMRPFAPRAVPDDRVWNEAAGEWEQVLAYELHVVAPNTYDDSDGDGIRNDLEVTAGRNPFGPDDGPYTVKLDAKGGSGGTEEVEATYGEAMPEIVVPVRAGYAFKGYFTAAGGKGTQYYKADGTSAKAWSLAGNATLYAAWEALPKQVTTFKGNGGTPETQKTTNTVSMAYGTLP